MEKHNTNMTDRQQQQQQEEQQRAQQQQQLEQEQLRLKQEQEQQQRSILEHLQQHDDDIHTPPVLASSSPVPLPPPRYIPLVGAHDSGNNDNNDNGSNNNGSNNIGSNNNGSINNEHNRQRPQYGSFCVENSVEGLPLVGLTTKVPQPHHAPIPSYTSHVHSTHMPYTNNFQLPSLTLTYTSSIQHNPTHPTSS